MGLWLVGSAFVGMDVRLKVEGGTDAARFRCLRSWGLQNDGKIAR